MAAVASGVVVVVAFGAGLLVNVLVSHRLVAQVSDQVQASLAAAARRPSEALAAPRGELRFQDPGGRYGLGIYGSPIFFWQVRDGRLVRSSAGAPPLVVAGLRAGGASVVAIGADSFLVAARADQKGLGGHAGDAGSLLVAGESLAELDHVRSVLETAELLALPILAAVAFFASLAIGIRSVVPVEESRRRQLEFTADASHELRTPLSVIEAELGLRRRVAATSSGAEAAGGAKGQDDPTATALMAGDHEMLDRVAAETARLTKIVEDLLWLARFDAEPPPPRFEPIDLATVAATCAGRFEPVAASRRLELAVHLPSEDDAPLVAAPPEWIDRLTGVLVDNACRHAGSPGVVRVTVAAVGGRARLVVEDSGPGIAAEQREHLFDRFARSRPGHEPSGSGAPSLHEPASHGGSHGLGLAIADSIVRSTRGRWRIGASPDLGGALLEVSWPIAR